MRVLVISSYREILNAVRPEGELLIGLHRRPGAEVTVMTQGDTAYAERFREVGIRVIDFHPTKKIQPAAVRFIREELATGGYDILHLYNNKAIINGIQAARGLPVRIVTYRGYTGNIHWWNPLAYLQHLHPRVAAITCVSPAVKVAFDRLPGFDSAKAVVVGKGHDPAWYDDVVPTDLSQLGLDPQRITICVVANARRMKGMPYLLAAVAQLPAGLPLNLLFVGRGLDTESTRKQLSQSYYGAYVRFTGFRRDALELIKASDLSVLASIKGEGLSKVLLESMFLARPTVMTDIGGNEGLAIDGETALIVPPRDAKALAAAIERLARDEALRKKMGEAGRRFVTEHYGVEQSVRDLLSLYQRLLAT